jgi:hypothetical protein
VPLELLLARCQIAAERGRALVALLGLLLQELHEDARERLREVGAQGAGGLGHARDVGVDQRERIGELERRAAGRGQVEDGSERVQIAARVDAAVHPAGLLGCDVALAARGPVRRGGARSGGRAADVATQAPRVSEVDQGSRERDRIDQDVGRRDVAVDDAGVVDALEHARQLGRDLEEGGRRGQGAAHPVVERAAGRALHDQDVGRRIGELDRPRHARARDRAQTLELALQAARDLLVHLAAVGLEDHLDATGALYRHVHVAPRVRAQGLREGISIRRLHGWPADPSVPGAQRLTREPRASPACADLRHVRCNISS